MRVKIGDQTFDPNDVMISIYLTPEDREQVSSMAPDAAVYCQYPEEISAEIATAELKQFREEVESNDN